MMLGSLRNNVANKRAGNLFALVSRSERFTIASFSTFSTFSGRRPCSSLRRSFSSKVVASVEEAVKDIPDRATLVVGGFGASGVPHAVLQAIQRKGVRELTIISCDANKDGWGLGLLLQSRQIKRMVGAFFGFTQEFQRQFLAGEIEAELTPMGTLVERLRSGGAGIPAFYTATGSGTLYHLGGLPIKMDPQTRKPLLVSLPKEERVFNGRTYLLEYGITGDFALVRAHQADRFGNLKYRHTARNFNPAVATAGKVTIAEVEEIVDRLDPNEVHTPGIYVHRVVCPPKYKVDFVHKRIRKDDSTSSSGSTAPAKCEVTVEMLRKMPVREQIARRGALEVAENQHVNLGIGLPTLIPSFLPSPMRTRIQSENGLLGVGPYPTSEEDADPNLCNAGNETINFCEGSCVFSSDQAFGMIRSTRIDVTFIGALQVSVAGDLANWMVPGKVVRGMGGAMDLAASGSRVVVLMQHRARPGAAATSTDQPTPKLVKQCTLPLTGRRTVSRIITEMAVLDVDRTSPNPSALTLVELSPLYMVEQVRAASDCPIEISPNLVPMRYAM